MKNLRVSYFIFLIFIISYVAILLGAVLNSGFLLGFFYIGIFFCPLAMIFLIIDRFKNTNYEKKYFKIALGFLILTVLITALFFYSLSTTDWIGL